MVKTLLVDTAAEYLTIYSGGHMLMASEITLLFHYSDACPPYCKMSQYRMEFELLMYYANNLCSYPLSNH